MRCVWGLVLLWFACTFEAQFEDASSGPPRVAFEFTMSGADEQSGTFMVPVILTREAPDPVSVRYLLLDARTATPGVDFTVMTGTLTFAPGETRKEIPVTVNRDNDEMESVEMFDIALEEPVGAMLDEMRAIHSVRIADHILPRANLLGQPTMASENAPSSLTVQLTAPAEPDSYVVIGVSPGNPGAVAADMTIVDGAQITIPTGAMMVSIPIGEKDDPLDEEDAEVAIFTLRGASPNIVLGTTKTQNHSILDNDSPPLVRFMNGTSSTTEAGIGTTVTPTVSLSAPSGRRVRVTYQRDANDTAVNEDATVLGSGGTLTFEPGETTKNITVVVANDQIDEDSETVLVNLTNPENATLGTPSTHTLTINDNDTASVSFAASSGVVDEDDAGTIGIRIQLSIESAKTVSVPITINGGSTIEADDLDINTTFPVVFQPGVTAIDISVTVHDNSPGSEPNETMILDIGTPTNANRGPTTRFTLTILE